MTESAPAAAPATGRAWLALCALLGAASLLASVLPAALLDWQPGRAAAQPWRCWSAAFVHWSALHLGANLLGLAVVAALGVVAATPGWVAAAWALAWPLTHLGLLLQPALAHYGGLSGVLHAGVAAAATGLLLVAGPGARRRLALALLGGLALKVLLEAPWGSALRVGGGWDIAVAPLAHASGAAAGVLATLGAAALRPRRRAR